jgi:hypothetical protein
MQIKQLWKRCWQRFGAETANRRRLPLHLERLEARTVPTLLFSSNGVRTVAYLGGPVIQNADVDLIFWGAGWTTGQGPTLQANIQQAVTTFLASPYLSGLAQYGVGAGQLLRTDLITNTSPMPNLTNADFGAFIQANLNDGTLPVTPEMDSQILYLVIPQLGTSDPAEGAEGAHYWGQSNSGLFHYAWTANDAGNLDSMTIAISHELTEAATDPEVNLNTAYVVPSTYDEICADDATAYTDRLDVVLVQSFLSQEDQAYAIYDGNTQQFLVSYNRSLTINGGQLADPNDTITVDGSSAGGYLVTLNGETVQFDPGWIKEVIVNTGNGNDTVNIAHIQNVIGGSSSGPGLYNILIGNGGTILKGEFGRRNLLIAGASAGTLLGGGDDDILIAGTTAYDTEAGNASLVALMTYWSSTANDYATRVANVTTGNGVPLLDPTTVTSNGGGNTLMGDGGLNLWYGNLALDSYPSYNPDSEAFISV